MPTLQIAQRCGQSKVYVGFRGEVERTTPRTFVPEGQWAVTVVALPAGLDFVLLWTIVYPAGSVAHATAAKPSVPSEPFDVRVACHTLCSVR